LLPRPPAASLMKTFQSEMCSAPGRQAASFLRTNHMRALSSPFPQWLRPSVWQKSIR
jgi:hypothetical protein